MPPGQYQSDIHLIWLCFWSPLTPGGKYQETSIKFYSMFTSKLWFEGSILSVLSAFTA